MNKPHVHAELIKAWADGAKIEYWDTTHNQWLPCTKNKPTWCKHTLYRIKPAKITLGQARDAWNRLTWFWGNTPLSESLQTIHDYLFQEE